MEHNQRNTQLKKKNNLIGIVLAGGQSKRMGRDKALLCYHGKPQLEYLVELLSVHCLDVLISGQERDGLSSKMRFLADSESYSNAGPIGGVLTIWEAIECNRPILVLGCDYPFIDHHALEALLAARDIESFATGFYHSDSTPEPLLTLYEPKAFHELKQRFAQGEQSMKYFLKAYPCNLIRANEPTWLLGVDTPEQLRGVMDEEG
jgi:molybdopterin-guanine dinucleotide biosynthesis protein A